MPKSVKFAKIHAIKKSKSEQRKRYSSDTVDYRFGVAGDFKFQGKSFNAESLVEVCLKQMGMKAVLVPHTIQTTPKIVVVPDQSVAMKSAIASIDRQAYLLPFSSFLSLLMHKNQLELLRTLGFSHSQAEKFTEKLPAFCLSSSVHFHGLFLSHRFIRDSLTRMGFKVSEECSSENKKSISVGDVQNSNKYGEQLTHLSVPEFFALQPHEDLKRLHDLMLDAVKSLPIATNTPVTTKTTTIDEKPRKTPKPKKIKNVSGKLEISEEKLVEVEEVDIVDDDYDDEVRKQTNNNKREKQIDKNTETMVEVELDDDAPVAWVL